MPSPAVTTTPQNCDEPGASAEACEFIEIVAEANLREPHTRRRGNEFAQFAQLPQHHLLRRKSLSPLPDSDPAIIAIAAGHLEAIRISGYFWPIPAAAIGVVSH